MKYILSIILLASIACRAQVSENDFFVQKNNKYELFELLNYTWDDELRLYNPMNCKPIKSMIGFIVQKDTLIVSQYSHSKKAHSKNIYNKSIYKFRNGIFYLDRIVSFKEGENCKLAVCDRVKNFANPIFPRSRQWLLKNGTKKDEFSIVINDSIDQKVGSLKINHYKSHYKDSTKIEGNLYERHFEKTISCNLKDSTFSSTSSAWFDKSLIAKSENYPFASSDKRTWMYKWIQYKEGKEVHEFCVAYLNTAQLADRRGNQSMPKLLYCKKIYLHKGLPIKEIYFDLRESTLNTTIIFDRVKYKSLIFGQYPSFTVNYKYTLTNINN
jgi:hypothetical protein